MDVPESTAIPSALQALQAQIRPEVVSGWMASCSTTVRYPAASAFTVVVCVSTGEQTTLRSEFDGLVRKWRRETDLVSSITKTSMHPAYQAIIGMGEKALPLIFDELEHRGGHWFWALQAITRADPAHGQGDFDAAKRAWLDWWKHRAS